MTVTTAHVARFVRLFASSIANHREELTRLDAAVGDGDHGINMDRGMRAVLDLLPALEEADPGTLSKQVGMKLISTVGGASGPLYGTFFLRLGSALGTAPEVTSEAFVGALRAGLDGVIARGKAQLGEKTMVDAMAPAVDALEAAAGTDWAVALDAAARSAAEGRDRIVPLVARKGRASYLGERSAGHPDPGAASTTLLFHALRDTFADR